MTIESLSLSRPKNCGLSVMATTAFCTVLLVTSTGRCTSSLESICRVQEIPKTDVAAPFEFVRRRRVKYEKSSVALSHGQRGVEARERKLYAWAPSDKAMKGRKDQSLSMAGSMPSSTPNQLSISGPLRDASGLALFYSATSLPLLHCDFTVHDESRRHRLPV